MSNKAYDLPENPAGQSHARWTNSKKGTANENGKSVMDPFVNPLAHAVPPPLERLYRTSCQQKF